jgi:uncharacterized protein YdeI (YjbR/CyaY-like superfamily)
MKFMAKIIPSGNATGVEVPDHVVQSLGPQGRPPVSITINGHTWRSRVAAMRGQRLIGISAAHRTAAGIREGDIVEVDVEIDEAPRTVSEPADLAEALDSCAEARASFDLLPFGLRQKHVTAIENARSAAVRERRISRLVTVLRSGNPP